MQLFISLIYLSAVVLAADGIAVAGESKVVYRNDGRSGTHAQRVTLEEQMTMAVYPREKNVQIVVTVADQKNGSITGSRGRSGYDHAFRAND